MRRKQFFLCLHCSFSLLFYYYSWVKRDSYLPVGSQNLKATTKVQLSISMHVVVT